MAQRDTTRQRVYRAECVARGRTFGTFEEVLAYADDVTSSDWWQLHSSHSGPVIIKPRKAQRGRAKYATGVIILPPFAWYEGYLLHELAHLAHGCPHWHEAGHGPRYVEVLYRMIERFMGAEPAALFRRSALAHGIGSHLPIDSTDEETAPLHRAYAACYRKYKRGERSTPPNLRKGMTRGQAAAIRAAIDKE